MGSISFSQILGSRGSCEACRGNVGAIKLKKNIFYSRIKLKKNNSNDVFLDQVVEEYFRIYVGIGIMCV